jgi:hypothetical protein
MENQKKPKFLVWEKKMFEHKKSNTHYKALELHKQ